MTTTTRTSVPASTWTQVSTGSASVLVQISAKDTAEVYVGSSAPSGADKGHPLGYPDDQTSISFSVLGASDNVYVYSPFAISVTVTKS